MQFTLLNYGKATILTANEVNNEAEHRHLIHSSLIATKLLIISFKKRGNIRHLSGNHALRQFGIN